MSQRLEQRGRATTSLHARGVSAYPVLSPGEFKSACTALSEWFGGCWRGLGGCRSVRLTEDHGRVCLRITKDTFTAHGRGHLGPPPDSRDDETPGQGPASDGFEEFDEEALPTRTAVGPAAKVEYSIVLSPVYCVPVLYFTLSELPGECATAARDVYRHLVPETLARDVQSGGVMGGISMTDHPVTGLPAFFVHPCKTAEAMEQVRPDRDVKPEEYLLLWLGIVGASAGLHLPAPSAEEWSEARCESQ
ncbi:autophagy-related protein Atg10 [Cryomyces antarcticus]